MHNARNRRAATLPKRPARPPAMAHSAMGGQVPSFLLRAAEPQAPPAPALRSFPADVLIPPHRGAVSRSVELTTLAPPPAKPKRKSKPKRAPKPKATKRQKAKPAAPAAPVIALPAWPEALVTMAHAAPAAPLAPPPRLPLPPPQQQPARGPMRPLPRRRTLAPWRPGGLAAQIGFWLRERSRLLAGLLTPRRSQTPAPEAELALLRAENERLRLQIEALLALRPEELAPGG